MTMPGGDGGPQGTPANSGQGGEGGVQATLFTQDQVNKFNADAKRTAVGNFFKELGFDSIPDPQTVKDTFTAAGEYKKLKDGEKGDVQRLTDDLNSEKQKTAEIPSLKTTILRQRVAGELKLPVKFWKFVEGESEDDIKESVADLKKELDLPDDDGDGGDGEGQQRQSGTGARPPAPNPQQGRTSGGGTPGKTLASGAEAYAKKHGKNKE